VNTPSAIRRSPFTHGIVHLAILVIGIAGGLVLIYPLQPASTNSLVYELTLITTDKPINDFPIQLLAIQQRPPGRLALARTEMYGSIQLTSALGQTAQLQLHPHPGQITTYLGKKGFDFELRGEFVGDRVRTRLKIVDNDTTSSHQLDLREGEYRAILVPRGENDPRPRCYAFLKVSRVQSPPPAKFKSPNQWFPSNRRPSSPTKGP
jgi:hypothetical protein